ncbi:DUF6528 family protein [Kitasatospora sp. McL0602]|uniref:DUF6528 family protein n=1 Tax=Kitasatospora sp. McL0602 TaxID=3439530 RepID=UPI003F88E63C
MITWLPAPVPSRRSVVGAAVAALLAPGRPAAAQGLPTSDRSLVLAADQASGRVLLVDPNDLPWHDGRADVRGPAAARLALWSWSAADVLGLGGDGLGGDGSWWAVNEAKYRRWRGEGWVLTCASGGLAAMVSFPEGRVRWAARPGGNPHSLELLPDGRLVVVASDPGFVRLYSSSTRYTQYDLAGAHGVQWDADRRLLWVLSDRALTAFTTGDALAPVRSVPLPTPGGHDVGPAAPDRLWVTTNRHVYQYSIPADAFVRYPGDRSIDGPGIKSIGSDSRSGEILTVNPDSENTYPWCTSKLTFHHPDGTTRLAGASLYKARWLPG